MMTRPGSVVYNPPQAVSDNTPTVDPGVDSISDLINVSTVALTPPVIKIWVETATGLTHVSKLFADGGGNVLPADYNALTPRSWYDSTL
jgi:hypothetical protein